MLQATQSAEAKIGSDQKYLLRALLLLLLLVVVVVVVLVVVLLLYHPPPGKIRALGHIQRVRATEHLGGLGVHTHRYRTNACTVSLRRRTAHALPLCVHRALSHFQHPDTWRPVFSTVCRDLFGAPTRNINNDDDNTTTPAAAADDDDKGGQPYVPCSRAMVEAFFRFVANVTCCDNDDDDEDDDDEDNGGGGATDAGRSR